MTEDLRSYYSSSNIVTIIKSRWNTLGIYVLRMGDIRNVYTGLIVFKKNMKENYLFGDLCVDGRITLRLILT